MGARRHDQTPRNLHHRPHKARHSGAALPHQAHRPQRVNARRRRMSSNIVDPLAALSTHLAAFELPPVASIHVTGGMAASQVTVQLTGRDPAALAQGLLAWADTLTPVSAHKWRVPHGDLVHLSITGS